MSNKKNKLYLPDKYTYEDILNAYLDCRKRKRKSKQAIEFELNYEHNLELLLEEINSGKYKIGQTRVFIITDPKPREIWAANFKDRIVHHLIYNSIKKYYESNFIFDTYSCIKNKGTLKASERCYQFVRKCSENYNKKTYFAKIDIKNFFVSINKNILWKILKRKVGENNLVSKLIKQNIFHNPTKDYFICTNKSFSIVPKHKSLFNNDSNNYGLPIGNITSQFYSNIYLSLLDKYCKFKLKIKYYIRYVDDIIIINNSTEILSEYVNKINIFLKTRLNLCLHDNKIIINNIKVGIKFVGNMIKPFRFEPTKRIINKCFNSIRVFQKNIFSEHNFDSIQSYLGMLKHTNSYSIRKKICNSVCIGGLIKTNKDCTKLNLCY